MSSARELTAVLHQAVAAIRQQVAAEPEVAIILGTGLGQLADSIEVETELPYAELPGFPLSTVESHAGRLLFGRAGGRSVVAMQGRLHRYEGYDLQRVTFPVRVLRLLGARTLFVTSACGGMHPLWEPGDLVLLDDHINLMGENPLVGPNLDELGPRFPDMSEPYDRALQRLALEAALELGITLPRGVYVAVPGPNLETRAEYRMLRMLGADVVGMCTVPEVIVARHAGMQVLGVSIVTDACLPDALQPADITTIVRTAAEAEPRLAGLLARVAGTHALPRGHNRQRRMKYPEYPPNDTALEEEMLARWQREDLFRQTMERRATDPEPFVFYEGPPTANGRPGLHHVISRTIKDMVCRHRTMRGRHVTRIAGWDTHGLPVEIEAEKKLGISGKPEIEARGHRPVQRGVPRIGVHLQGGVGGALRAHRLLAGLLAPVRDLPPRVHRVGVVGAQAARRARGSSTGGTRACPTAPAAAPRCRPTRWPRATRTWRIPPSTSCRGRGRGRIRPRGPGVPGVDDDALDRARPTSRWPSTPGSTTSRWSTTGGG